ncbi:unnamed protein product [Closterium sp. Naga37s-1]|nr:unnamed protein product [Closterium sp. Naga37s-1]
MPRKLCPPEASPRALAAAQRGVGSGARESGDPAEPCQRWPSLEAGAARDAARAETHAASGTSGGGDAAKGAGWRGMAADGAAERMGRGGEVGGGAWARVARGGQAVSSMVHAGGACGGERPPRRLLCSAPSLGAAAAVDGGSGSSSGSMEIFNRRLKAMQVMMCMGVQRAIRRSHAAQLHVWSPTTVLLRSLPPPVCCAHSHRPSAALTPTARLLRSLPPPVCCAHSHRPSAALTPTARLLRLCPSLPTSCCSVTEQRLTWHCLMTRCHDCRRTFSSVLLLGGAALPSVLTTLLRTHPAVQRVVVVDVSPTALALARAHLPAHAACCNDAPTATDHTWTPHHTEHPAAARVQVAFVLADEEHLPFHASSFDAVISCVGLHWVNDLPAAMTHIRRALKPDGLFLAAMLGGDTLRELRIACTLAHMERQGGVAARVAPMAQVRDAGSLLTRAGFALPTVDVDEFPVAYPSGVQVQHLRSLGETDCTLHHAQVGAHPAAMCAQPLPRDTALAAAAIYAHMFPARPPSSHAHSPPDLAPGAEARGDEQQERDEDGVVATFQVIFMAGWAPHESQQRARPRGSAAMSLHALHHSLPA